jgi:hypothetical protein
VYFPSTGSIPDKSWQAADDALTARLGRIREFMTQLAEEVKIYRAKQQELQEYQAELLGKIRIARDALLVWTQSHHSLGKGIVVPPVIDVAGIAGGLAKKAVPVP